MCGAAVIVCLVSRSSPSVECRDHAERACGHARTLGIATALVTASSPHAVDHARNRGVALALQHALPWTHLLMLDDDVLIQEDTIPLLLSCEADVAGGCYPTMKQTIGASQALAPHVLVRREGRWATTWFDGVVDADGLGGGCMLIARHTFERVGFPWFRWPQRLLPSGTVQHASDDVDFVLRALDAGCSVRAHGNVRCSHLKTVDLSHFVPTADQPPWEMRWLGPRTMAQQSAWPLYGSHVPVLEALGPWLGEEARTLVEYGSGCYSTPVLCDRAVFPHAEVVLSYESDPRWLRTVAREVPDSRLVQLHRPLEQMPTALHPEADLVLIDCDGGGLGADCYQARCDLIRAYARMERPLVVVHDSNFPSLAPTLAEADFAWQLDYRPPQGPATAVLSNRRDLRSLQVRPSTQRPLTPGRA